MRSESSAGLLVGRSVDIHGVSFPATCGGGGIRPQHHPLAGETNELVFDQQWFLQRLYRFSPQ